VKSRLAVMPEGVTWNHLYGAGVLCGMGFTMSLFIADLAFHGTPQLDAAKMGTFVGSLLSFAVGIGLLALSARARPRT
jgi:Na+:H+ antiporter, NhaA family